jgi:hypothetical protein
MERRHGVGMRPTFASEPERSSRTMEQPGSCGVPSSHEIAQLNLARPLEPMNSALLAGFVELLVPVNALADAAPGFRWRLQTEDGDATALRGFGDDELIVNMSTWQSLDALTGFVFESFHAEVMRRRREWFARIREPFTVLWWVPAGHRPDLKEAEERLTSLRTLGPTARAFTFRHQVSPPVHHPARIDAASFR